MDFNFNLSTAGVGWRRPPPRVREAPRIDLPRWEVLTVIRSYPEADVDWYRVRFGKAEGERRFFADHRPADVQVRRGNMLLGAGASAIWQCLLGNGTTSANSALGAGPTYFNNSQTYIYVGDSGLASGSGTISVTNASTAVTFSGTQSGLQGKYLIVTGDSTNGFYEVISGSGTNWTLGTAYGGSTNAAAGWAPIVAESHDQSGLQATTNSAHQIMDSTFPSNQTSAQFNAITGATNASPIVLSMTSGDISTNDIIQVYDVRGNTAANGMWVANPASSSSVTLLGSTGNGSYTYKGIATKKSVIKFQATFGPGSGNFTWLEWSVVNGTGGNQVFLNRKVFSGGVKAGGSTSLQVGIGLG